MYCSRFNDGRTRSGNPRGLLGFTLIELLGVLSSALALAALSAPAVLKAVRRARVDAAANAVIGAANEARLLARRFAGRGDIFGVRVLDDPNDLPVRVEILRYDLTGDKVLRNSEGNPVYQVEVPDNAIVMTYDLAGEKVIDLRSAPNGTLEWWYQPQTGRVLRDPTDLIQLGGVGLPGVDLEAAFGRRDNTVSSNQQLWVGQTGDPKSPGLWVRDPAGLYGVAMRIYPSGVVFRKVMEELP